MTKDNKYLNLIVVVSLFAITISCEQTKTTATNQQNLTNPVSNVSTIPVSNLEIAAQESINFTASDGVKIFGTFYGVNGGNSPAVLMLHQYGGNRASYNGLARQFQSAGIAVLTIDGRGFGESTKKIDGSKVSVNQSAVSINGMKSDVAAAVNFLNEQKNVDKNRVGIIGASYGSSLAIIHAADNQQIKSVGLLSPGTNYFGNLPTEPAIEKYGARPILIVAAEDDEDSATASRKLYKLASGDKNQLQIYKKGGHGTGILAADVRLEKLLLEFFRDSL